MNIEKEKKVEKFSIFKRKIDQSIDENPTGEFIDWKLLTKGKLISEIKRDNNKMLIEAKFTYNAFNTESVLSEITENAFKSFISLKIEIRFQHLNLGSQGWFGEPLFEEIKFSLDKIEFTKLYKRNVG